MENSTTAQVPAQLDAAHRRVTVGGEPMIFHCHHYNTYLQQSIQDAEYIDSSRFLVGAASEVAYAQLTRLFQQRPAGIAERRNMAETLFRWAGFGRVSLAGVGEQGGAVDTENSHYSMAWKEKFGPANQPVDFFTTGWLAGALSAIYELPQGAFAARQTRCLAAGAASNRYELTRADEPNYSVYQSPGVGPLTDHKVRSVPASPVNYEGIFDALASMPIEGDEKGIIPAFGVYLTRHYANYYNRISFEFLRELEQKFGSEGASVAESLLVEAGHVCAFNTFGGIMTSSEWDALIRPQLESRQDWVHGIVAAVNALGWGRWQVNRISPDEAVFSIHDDYESVGYLANYGKADHPVSYLARGGVMGIMNLVYMGNVESKPEFSEAFYQSLFKSEASYKSEVLESRACGQEVTCFRVFR